MRKNITKMKVLSKPWFFFVLFIILFIFLFYVLFPEKIFSTNTIKIINFGDVMFDRGVRNIIENRKRDPFEYVKKDINILRNYDFIIVNLEGPITQIDRLLCQQKIYNFQFASNTPERLKSIGVNMVNIANNHSHDCYKKGFESTKNHLSNSGISYMGDNVLEKSFVVKEIKGKKIAFLGIDAVTPTIQISSFYPLVKKLKTLNDVVIVNIHWGNEYELQESKNQEAVAHKLIDNGADVIFGHHPHVPQPVKIYKQGAIFYSLGNFVFDQDFGDTIKSYGASVEIYDDKKVFEIFPYNMRKFAPEFMKGDERLAYCDIYLNNVSYNGCRFEIKL